MRGAREIEGEYILELHTEMMYECSVLHLGGRVGCDGSPNVILGEYQMWDIIAAAHRLTMICHTHLVLTEAGRVSAVRIRVVTRGFDLVLEFSGMRFFSVIGNCDSVNH